MIRVAAYTGGWAVPSARFRVRQHIPGLSADGIDLQEFACPVSSYPPLRRLWRPAWAAANLVERFCSSLQSHRYDATLLQREMLSTYATCERFTRTPRLLDVDDAIWIYRNGRAAEALARAANLAICGNAFLAEYFGRRTERIAVVPTAVDVARYTPPVSEPEGVVIGWIGAASGFAPLYAIEDALAKVLRRYPQSRLRVISDCAPRFQSLTADFVKWSDKTEVAALQGIAVGIMPLDDSTWSRGKCSYKLLTYMACGRSTVASLVGMNAEVLSLGRAGLGARTHGEWVDALSELVGDDVLRRKMGAEGRRVAVENFSLEAVTPRLAAAIRQVV